MNKIKKLAVVIRQIQQAETKEAKRHYCELLMRYRTYHPVKHVS